MFAALTLLPAASFAQNSAQAPAAPAAGPGDILALAEAYQSGYLQVVAIACFQLYSMTGIIATDFQAGNVDAPKALNALDQNALLHSACYTSLRNVQQLTPADDPVARQEMGQLASILEAEDALLKAVEEAISQPSKTGNAAMETARGQVEAALRSYSGESVSTSPPPAAQPKR